MKNHSYNLHTLICGIFCPHSVDVARYAAFIRTKSPTNYDAHLAESIFQTHSRAFFKHALERGIRITMKHKLTQQDVDKMKAEIEHRKVEVRPELLEHVKEARAHGDLSENFEYHAAKKEKNRNESRIRYLERMIRTCEIVEDHSDADQVGLNKTVTLYFEEDDEVDKFSFVTTVLVDTMQNRVSIESPLGKALLGHKKGERVYIPVNPQYGYYVEIREIEPFNEDVPLNEY